MNKELFGGRSLIQPVNKLHRMGASITWVVLLPALIWAITKVYIPILGASMSAGDIWWTTGLIALMVGGSLLAHGLAHLAAAYWLGADIPARITFFLYGDASQAWPAGPTPWKEAACALAGFVPNLLLAGISYLVWNAQFGEVLNLSMAFSGMSNIWLLVINLTPAYPLDGGRLVHALIWGLLGQKRLALRIATGMGYLLCGMLLAWGIYLWVQQDRYSLATTLATIGFALLIGTSLMSRRGDIPEDGGAQKIKLATWRSFLVGWVILALAILPVNLLLTNDGFEAPGFALSIEPMVTLPAQYNHHPSGTFILTSVLFQSPIPVAGWLLAQVSPIFRLLPAEKPAPHQVSAQETARQNFQMLDESTTTAAVVGVRLAGFKAEQAGKGATVVSILPESLANGILKLEDVVTAINGQPVQVAQDLIDQVRVLAPGAVVKLHVIRSQAGLDLEVKLLPPAETGGTPRLGISIQTAGFENKLPFDVKIVPQKIVGGPSAGLMFSLTVYNLLSPTDLTGGRKIAGTGTISLDGTVGPIGGVQQKVAAAEFAGAEYFLSPAENYADALSAARHIKVIRVTSVDEAVTFLKSLRPLNGH